MQPQPPLPLLLLAVTLGFAGCVATQQEFEAQHWDEKTMGPIPDYTATVIDVVQSETIPDSGSYYELQPADFDEQTRDVPRKLRRLYVLGIVTTMAWFRQSGLPCEEEPQQGRVDRYPGFLILRLDQPEDAMIRYGFQPISRPKKFLCPYAVSLYRPVIP